MGPKIRRRLPEPTHPAWKLAQQGLTLGAVLLVIYHLGGAGLDHGHLDTGDAVGGTLIVKELLYWLKRSAINGDAYWLIEKDGDT
jgi:hypothetical protein